MTKKVSKLLRAVPQLSLPYPILGVVDLVLDTLATLRNQLLFLQRQSSQVDAMTQRAAEPNDAGLAAIAAYARANLEQEAANLDSPAWTRWSVRPWCAGADFMTDEI